MKSALQASFFTRLLHRQHHEGVVSRFHFMEEEFVEGNFLGLPQREGDVDVAIVPLAYELTTSYGTGTAQGPSACIDASAQVELYDSVLGQDLPAGLVIATVPEWEGTRPTLLGQLDELADHASAWYNGACFPLFLGGEHGILPPVIRSSISHPLVDGNLDRLTVVQIDAHADLRASLDGEPFSHACAAARTLDTGIGKLLQVGIRAYSREEAALISSDTRITTYFAKDTQHPHSGTKHWDAWLNTLRSLKGPVHLTLDLDGLDGALVPATGTPVPGGLSFWQVIETIETLFQVPEVSVIGADVNEIGCQEDTPLTQFTAAQLATKIVACHALARKEQRWAPTPHTSSHDESSTYFRAMKEPQHSVGDHA